MKCPYCGKDMEDGFIQGARGVLFSPYEKVVLILKNPFSKRDVKLTNFLESSSPAFYCYDCECLIWKKNSEAVHSD